MVTLLKNVKIGTKDIKILSLDRFVHANTKQFFNRLGISTDFLKVDPAKWEQRADYPAGLKIVKNLVVINDRTLRAVAALTKFLHKTKDEEIKK